MNLKPKLLFLYELSPDLYAEDGLHAALELLKTHFEITKANINIEIPVLSDFDFVLGHGGWGSKVDTLIKSNRDIIKKCGLCIGGNLNPPDQIFIYDALFCETNWYLPQIQAHPNSRVAFGINSDIFYPTRVERTIDYLGVGSFANWKRWELMSKKKGLRIVVGEIQKNNPIESMSIIGNLLQNNIGVIPNVDPETLAKLYNSAKTVYIPSTNYGGGERSIWEAKSCGCEVECEPDNLKLKELVKSYPKTQFNYASELLTGINKVI